MTPILKYHLSQLPTFVQKQKLKRNNNKNCSRCFGVRCIKVWYLIGSKVPVFENCQKVLYHSTLLSGRTGPLCGRPGAWTRPRSSCPRVSWRISSSSRRRMCWTWDRRSLSGRSSSSHQQRDPIFQIFPAIGSVAEPAGAGLKVRLRLLLR